MRGLSINRASSSDSCDRKMLSGSYDLLARGSNIEVTRTCFGKNAAIWLTPAEDPDTLEMFYIISGNLTLHLPEGDVVLGRDDSFCIQGLRREVVANTDTDSILLCISSTPQYDEVAGLDRDINDMLSMLDSKDSISIAISRLVVRYAVAIFNSLGANDVGLPVESFVAAALLRDIGKTEFPSELLKKRSGYTEEELEIIATHPQKGAEILEPKMGRRTASIVLQHHERLDGSGYPMGLLDADICLEARIIAVAETFAELTFPDYSGDNTKTPEAAIAFLKENSALYDIRISNELERLISTGKLKVG